MPAIKNRTVLEVAKNLKGFLNLEAGLTRSLVPNYEQRIKEAQSTTRKHEHQLQQTQKRLSKRERRIQEARGQLQEALGQARDAQKQLSDKEQQLQAVSGQLQETRRRLLSKNRETAALPSIADSSRDTASDEELYTDIAKMLDRIPIDLGGGCSLDKAYLFAWLIRRHGLKQTVDIGVYRGRSLFPQALAHTQFTGGVAYGVDPYSALEAKEENIEWADKKDKEAVNRFIKETDWETICRSVVSLKDELGYGGHCVLLKETSAAAAAYFEENGISFGMVHVDGNHDTDKVMEDLDLYLPRVEENGFIVLDDISFKSVRPAYDRLNSSTTLVFERTDQDNANDFAVFRNAPQPPGTRYNRRLWTRDFW